MIQDSYFFSDLIEANVCNENFLPFLEEYSNQIQKQVYAIWRKITAWKRSDNGVNGKVLVNMPILSN